MDNFQELFAGGETWPSESRDIRTDNISSTDSPTPPPQIDDKDDKKSANSIRGSSAWQIKHTGEKRVMLYPYYTRLLNRPYYTACSYAFFYTV